MNPTDPPTATGNEGLLDSLDGMLLLSRGVPGQEGQIEPVQIHNGPLAVLVFSNLATLERFRIEFSDLDVAALPRIVVIDDTRQFFEDIPPEMDVALDLRRTERGTVIYGYIAPLWRQVPAEAEAPAPSA